MAVDRINKAGGINGRPVEIVVADDESKPDVGRRKTEKMLDRGQDRRPRRRLPLQHLPRLHAGVRGAQGPQHDQRVSRHHADHDQVQPIQLPALRLRAVAGGGVRALPGQQDGQEVAHRLRRLLLGPVDARRLRAGDQEGGRRGCRHHRHSARHRRHDAVPVQDHRQFRRHVRHLLRQGWRDHRQPGVRSRPDQEVQVGRRRRDRRVDQPAGARQQDRRLRRHQPLHPGARSRRSTRRRTRSSSTRPRRASKEIDSIATRIRTATCSRTTRR